MHYVQRSLIVMQYNITIVLASMSSCFYASQFHKDVGGYPCPRYSPCHAIQGVKLRFALAALEVAPWGFRLSTRREAHGRVSRCDTPVGLRARPRVEERKPPSQHATELSLMSAQCWDEHPYLR
jgi:hypothetical protein